jgi:hypothetical protein
MARFMFALVGTPQRPVLDLPESDLGELQHSLGAARFIGGRMVQIDGGAVDTIVLIPVSRIQMIMELTE